MNITVVDKKPTKAVRIELSKEIKAPRFVDANGMVLMMPCEDIQKLSRRQWNILVRKVVRTAKAHQLTELTMEWSDFVQKKSNGGDVEHQIEHLAENLLLAGYEFTRYKSHKKGEYTGVQKVIVVAKNSELVVVKRGIKRGFLVAKHLNFCRDLANTPGNDMTPKKFVGAVKKAIVGKNVKLTVLSERKIKELGMGGVVAVGKGSSEESQFMILEYRGGKMTEAPTVLVGKGVTFDTGGIDTKPHPYALEMMMDMSGGAAVLTTLLVAHDLGIKKNLVALVPAVENMPGGESFRPGDVIKMLDGTHVEIGHTDAEGRLILGDAITYAKKYKPETVIEVSTLTGAAEVALGERAAALFSRSDILAEKLVLAGEQSGDYAWRLPLWEEYEQEIKGTVGDIANIRTAGRSGPGGAITAACFLQHFAKDLPAFAHIDMAPSMTSSFDEELAKGAKGSPVRLLVRYLENN